MITYVNTVFVSNGNNTAVATDEKSLKKGEIVIKNIEEDGTPNAGARFKIGMGTGKKVKDHNGNEYNDVKWSNIINPKAIKSMHTLKYNDYEGKNPEDKVEIDFANLDGHVLEKFQEGGKRIIVRLTFKDTPTRYRKWTESYEYVTKTPTSADQTADSYKEMIVKDIKDIITKQWKRARVVAEANGSNLVLTAMEYDDDNAVETLNWAEKVRFNANVYWTDPSAEGWDSKNKFFPTGVKITKTPGETYPAAAKLVRDREAQAMGYLGILNRGNGTWPIIKPDMETNLDNNYNALTLEFENPYHTPDDMIRTTKQTVEIYTTGDPEAIKTKIEEFIAD